MKSTISTAAFLLLASGVATVQAGQWDFLTKGDWTGSWNDWQDKANSAPRACSIAGASMDDCQVLGGTNNIGLLYTAGFTMGTQHFSKDDADVVKCMIDLHFRQNDACIAVKGSKCDINGYVGKGGRVQQTNVGQGTSTGDGWVQISQPDSAAMQAATERLIGKEMRTDHSKFPVVGALEADQMSDLTYIMIKYVGENEC